MRAWRISCDLQTVTLKFANASPNSVLLFANVRDEENRLPFFLDYYRKMGIEHFFFVDNGSRDGSLEFLRAQPDVSLWQTQASYKRSRFGVDWLNWLKRRYAHGLWTLTVDVDEFLVYPFCDTRPITALTDALVVRGKRSFGTLLLDMYSKGDIREAHCPRGQDPVEVLNWFDPGNYTIRPNKRYGNLWIQGGPRSRVFFKDSPAKAPALNKIPLVRWHRKFTYLSSTHSLLPRELNLVYETGGGEMISGCLLHTKFLDQFGERARTEREREEHFENGNEYRAYQSVGEGDVRLWCDWSERYNGWRQLELLGLMSKGNWV